MSRRSKPSLHPTIRNALRGLALAALVLLLISLPRATKTEAIFHIAYMSEIMAGYSGDADVQYMEVRMEFPGQHLVDDTRISAWNADGSAFDELMILDGDVPNDGVNVFWIAATQAFADLTGLTPDFIMPPGIVTPSGMLCWGAPDFAPPSDQWDPQFPFLYTDCVAYGGYTGGNSLHRPPSDLPPGDGALSLTRILPLPQLPREGEAAHLSAPPDADSFALRCPSPQNNAGEIALMGEDSDSDGLPDCHEGEQSTDPAEPDTDGDGFADGEEFFAGSDPTDPASTPGGPTPTPAGPTATPPLPILGDIDGSGVSSTDALLVLQFVADLLQGLDPSVADVNCNGGITSIDALLILQHVAGLPLSPAQGCRPIGT